MAFCFRCQAFTVNREAEIIICKNRQLRQRAFCACCGARKSCLLSHNGRSRIMLRTGIEERSRHIQTVNGFNGSQPSAFTPVTRPLTNYEEMRREELTLKNRVEMLIHHQWSIDHVPGYYEVHKKRKENGT